MYIGTIPVSKRHTVGNLSEEQDEESPNSVEETGFNESETLFYWQNVLIFDRNDAFFVVSIRRECRGDRSGRPVQSTSNITPHTLLPFHSAF